MVRIRKLAFAAVFLASTHGDIARAEGNIRSHIIGAFANWIIRESEALPEYKDNIPDTLSMTGRSDIGVNSIQFICITRTVDADIPTQHIVLNHMNFRRDGHNQFDLKFLSPDVKNSISMFTFSEGRSSSLRLSPQIFESIRELFDKNQVVNMSFVSSSGQQVNLSVRGSERLRSFWQYCDKYTS